MKQYLINILAALFLGLCAATSFVLVRSFFVGDEWTFVSMHDHPRGIERIEIGLWMSKGGISIMCAKSHYLFLGGHFLPVGLHHWSDDWVPLKYGWTPRGPMQSKVDRLGLYFDRWKSQGTYGDTKGFCLIFPVFAGNVLFLLLPGLWLKRRGMFQSQRSAYACGSCGYDLRATPRRCPECGTAPTVAAI